MTTKPLNVAFVWHMHQPFYKDLATGEIILPWVRLHAIKDYFDLPSLLDQYPKIRQTFNLVPSLLMQIEEYASGSFKEKHFAVAKKDPEALSFEEKVFMLKDFFILCWDTMVKPYPRYYDLLLKRGRFVSANDIKKVAKRFSNQELLDLQVWANLVWFGPVSSKDPFIKGLFEKGKDFTAEEKYLLLQKQIEVVRAVIPKYKELVQRGQIELSTTPFYHPILPLLFDSNNAKMAIPQIRLPLQRLQYPEDAEHQINQAVDFFKSRFDFAPRGMWPSEGSVCEDMLPAIKKAGIEWIATDEGILFRSLGLSGEHRDRLRAEDMYRPYIVNKDGQQVYIIFRDHKLSDKVGFIYSRWKGADAARDLVSILEQIRRDLPEDGNNYIVPIILDGENAWEYFPDGGMEFFNTLYALLSDNRDILTTTVADFIRQNPICRSLPRLFAGSWVNSDFRVWIGHQEDNTAWDYLSRARATLKEIQETAKDNAQLNQRLQSAWEEIYIAEGSDWFWWYGDDHSSENDEVFDRLFRKNLENIYTIIGKPAPSYLDKPIKVISSVKPQSEVAYLINPVIDGEVTDFYEWLPAGLFNVDLARGSMHRADTAVKEIYYGFSLKSFFVRIDLNLFMEKTEKSEFSFAIEIFSPHGYLAELKYDQGRKKYQMALSQRVNEEMQFIKEMPGFGVGSIIEIEIPFAEIEASANQQLEFCAIVNKNGQELERWPRDGFIGVTIPNEDYEKEHWFV